VLLGIINFPWVVKIMVGMISDNYTFLGSRRKSYLVIASVINIGALVLLMVFGMKYGKAFLTACIFLSQLCMTYCDAIADALIV